jgi:hypothetical protein
MYVIVYSFIFLVFAVGMAAGLDWISEQAFGIALLLILGVLVAA